MRRREFIVGLGGAAAWPVAAWAQQGERLRRIGVLMLVAENDPTEQRQLAAFRQRLQQLGWTEGGNLRLEYRWGRGDAALLRKYAAELVALDPDVILARGSGSVGALLQETRTLPIVFVGVVDPVGGGLVASLARPGGNATGFTSFEYSLSGKWMELLKEIAPRVRRVAVIRSPVQFAGIGQFGAIQAVAPAFGVELTAVDVRDPGEITRAVTAFSQRPDGGLIVTGSGAASVSRHHIIELAAKLRLPAVYPARDYAIDGGLIAYAPELIGPFLQAAGSVDRILRGEKPADLPVQGPTKFELVINLKTAKALDLTIPEALLLRADAMIE